MAIRLAVFAGFMMLSVHSAAFAGAQVHRQQLTIPAELQAPLAAIVRLATGLEADKVCNQMTAPENQLYKQQMTEAVRVLYQRLASAGIRAAKSESILRKLMEEGENLARFNYPTCTNGAPDIIVKAMQDAECINPYLAGTDTACFR